MIDTKQMGEAMRRARALAGMKVADLAKAAQVMPETIRAYEAGRTLPGLYNLTSIADALDIGLDELVGRRTESGEARLRVVLHAMRRCAADIERIAGAAAGGVDDGQKPD